MLGESVDGVGSGRGSRSRYEPRFSDPVGECLRAATMDSVEANTRHHGTVANALIVSLAIELSLRFYRSLSLSSFN